MEKPQVGAPGKAARARYAAFKGYKDGSSEFLGNQIEGLVGYSSHEFNSKAVKWMDLALAEDRAQMKRVFAQALDGDKTYMREYRVRAKSGAVLWIREWSQIVCDESDQIDFVTGIIMDITEEKQQEMLVLNSERKTGKYLTFSVEQEEYGISILKVKEIIEVIPITALPQAPTCIKGVINLRGRIIPVMDLRTKLGIRESENTDRTCIIVLEATVNGSAVVTGIVVDSVSEVLHIKGADIEEINEFMLQFNSDCVLGMAKMNTGLKIILDVDKVFGGVEFAAAGNF